MEEMIAAGAPMAAVIIAVRALEAKDAEIARRDAAVADKRAKDAARKRRDRGLSEELPGNVHGQSEEHDGTRPGHTPSLDKETSPRPPKEINPNPERDTRARGTRLPVGWSPTLLAASTVSGRIVADRGEAWERRAFESFENHWRAKTGKDAVKCDWQATWANWVIEQDRRDGRNGQRRTDGMAGNNGRSASGHGRTVDAALAFITDGEPH
ncbi:hypothetical protein Q5H94_02045 [Sphingomonas sp. CA1-15]|uniref:Uncharacterized protein n=2 Tax=Sphingomonas immobilis TaxID=3063997 RepID=A0ABT8ZU49_9SPHN|nr:hypothetical protein [Sphingomonas sp. CA1-15]